MKFRAIIVITVLTSLILGGCTHTEKTPVTVASSPTPNRNIPPKPSAKDIKAANQYRQTGIEYRNQGRYTEAIQALSKSVQLDPTNLSGQVILGWTFHLDGKEQDAINTLQKALAQAPDHVPALNALGIVYLVKGDLSAAVETHTKAIKLKPDNEIAHYNLSLAYHRLKQYEQAITHAQKATTLEADNPHPWVALALVYWDQGDKTKAKQTYQQALILDPRYRQAWFLSHLKQAGFSVEQIQGVEQIRKSIS